MPDPRDLRSAFDDADLSPGLALWRTTNAWQAAQRRALKPLGLTHVQFVLLASLTWLASTQPITQRVLAAHAHTDPMMTSQVLRVLEGRGLITREVHPDDRRAWSLRATTEGRRLANSAITVVEGVDREFFGVLADHGQRLAHDLNIVCRTRA